MNLNFSGVWKGNLEKSKLLGPAPNNFGKNKSRGSGAGRGDGYH